MDRRFCVVGDNRGDRRGDVKVLSLQFDEWKQVREWKYLRRTDPICNGLDFVAFFIPVIPGALHLSNVSDMFERPHTTAGALSFTHADIDLETHGAL